VWSQFTAWRRSISTQSSLISPLLFVLKNMSFPIHPLLLRHGVGPSEQIKKTRQLQRFRTYVGIMEKGSVIGLYYGGNKKILEIKKTFTKINRVCVSKTIAAAAAAADIWSICSSVSDRPGNHDFAWSITRQLPSLIPRSGPAERHACVHLSGPFRDNQLVNSLTEIAPS